MEIPVTGEAADERKKAAKRKKEETLHLIPVKSGGQETFHLAIAKPRERAQMPKQEEMQIKTAYQLMADYRIYYPAASVDLPIVGRQKLLGSALGFIRKEIVFDPLTDSAIYRNANKDRIGEEARVRDLPADISACAATYFSKVEKGCGSIARDEKDATVRSLVQSLAKEAREHARMARQAGNDRVGVLEALLEFRDVHEEHIGRIVNEEYWNRLHAEAGGNSLQHGQLYVKRYGETALFFLALGASAATGGVAAPWAFGMMGSKAAAHGIVDKNLEEALGGLAMLIPFSPNIYAKQLGTIMIGKSVASDAIRTASTAIRTGTLTPDDRAAVVTNISMLGGFAKPIAEATATGPVSKSKTIRKEIEADRQSEAGKQRNAAASRQEKQAHEKPEIAEQRKLVAVASASAGKLAKNGGNGRMPGSAGRSAESGGTAADAGGKKRAQEAPKSAHEVGDMLVALKDELQPYDHHRINQWSELADVPEMYRGLAQQIAGKADGVSERSIFTALNKEIYDGALTPAIFNRAIRHLLGKENAGENAPGKVLEQYSPDEIFSLVRGDSRVVVKKFIELGGTFVSKGDIPTARKAYALAKKAALAEKNPQDRIERIIDISKAMSYEGMENAALAVINRVNTLEFGNVEQRSEYNLVKVMCLPLKQGIENVRQVEMIKHQAEAYACLAAKAHKEGKAGTAWALLEKARAAAEKTEELNIYHPMNTLKKCTAEVARRGWQEGAVELSRKIGVYTKKKTDEALAMGNYELYNEMNAYLPFLEAGALVDIAQNTFRITRDAKKAEKVLFEAERIAEGISDLDMKKRALDEIHNTLRMIRASVGVE